MAFLQRNTTIYAGSNYNPLTVQKPSGTAEGDMMVAWLCGDSATRKNITPPSGWSVIYNQSSPDLGGSAQMFGYYKVATASEPSSYDFTFSGSVGFSKGILTSYYDTNGTGTWTVSSIGGGNTVDAASITSLPISGSGLYVTAFLSDSADNPTTDNSPVPEIARNVASSLGFITYGGDYTATNHTITQTFDAIDDLYANNVIFAHSTTPTTTLGKINKGGTFKDITSGKVYVSGVWKNIVKGHLYVSGVWKEMF